MLDTAGAELIRDTRTPGTHRSRAAMTTLPSPAPGPGGAPDSPGGAPDSAGGARVAYRQQLADLDRALINLVEEVAELVTPVTRGFLEADAHALARMPSARAGIDARAAAVEESCYLVLVRQQPVGGDLRHVVAVLRSVQEVQLAANLVCHVAEAIRWVHPPTLAAQLRAAVGELGTIADAILHGAAHAWDERDALAATDLARADDAADAQQTYLLTELYTGDHPVDDAVSLALVARYYERLADHGVEIARQLAYFLTGSRPAGTPTGNHRRPAP